MTHIEKKYFLSCFISYLFVFSLSLSLAFVHSRWNNKWHDQFVENKILEQKAHIADSCYQANKKLLESHLKRCKWIIR